MLVMAGGYFSEDGLRDTLGRRLRQ